MDRAKKIIAVLVLIDFVYATINLVLIGLWLPLIPVFEIFIATIFFTGFYYIHSSILTKWVFFLPLTLLFLAHSELILNLFLNSKQLSLYGESYIDRVKLLAYIFLLALIIFNTLHMFNNFLIRGVLILLGISAVMMLMFGYNLMAAITFTAISLSSIVFPSVMESEDQQKLSITNYTLIGYASLLLIQSVSFHTAG